MVLDFVYLQELIVNHLFSVLEDPLTDFARVDLLCLLSHFCRVVLLLLVHLGALLHCHDFLMLAFGLDIGLVFLSFDSVELFLLPSNLALEISPFFGLLLLDSSPIFSLLFDLLHHGHFLRLHLANLLFHLLRLELLLIQSLCELCLLLLLLL